jgi:hypothetical protein
MPVQQMRRASVVGREDVAVLLVCLVGWVLGGVAPASARPSSPAPPSGPSLHIFGESGTFGSLAGQVPSGQELVQEVVPGWDFSPGRQFFATEVGADNTVFTAGLSHRAGFGFETGDDMVIGALDPATESFTRIQLRARVGTQLVEHLASPDGTPQGASIGDLEPLDGGQAMAFVAPNSFKRHGVDTVGEWPAFGVLTKVNGRWQVASGPGWTNQWTGGELGGTVPAGLANVCPPEFFGPADKTNCRGPNEMDSFAASQDIVIAQYAGFGDNRGGSIMTLRVIGPDAAGRYTAAVTGHYEYPDVDDRSTPETGDFLRISPREVHTDPTRGTGDERFTVTFDVWNSAGVSAPPAVVQEFSYDATHADPALRIRPVSSPVIPGDVDSQSGRPWGYATNVYDGAGNLWIPRADGFAGGKLAVFATNAGTRKLTGAGCAADPANPANVFTQFGTRWVWGKICAPDYDIVQNEHLDSASQGLTYDPATGDVVNLTVSGRLLAVRPAGAGPNMDFRVGAMVDIGRDMLPSTPLPGTSDLKEHRLAAIDSSHRLWFPVMHTYRAADPAQQPRMQQIDQWMISLDVGDLIDPEPLALPSTAGWWRSLQAENTLTNATVETTPPGQPVQVRSVASMRLCRGESAADPNECADQSPHSPDGRGYLLPDPGVPTHYRISVSTAGTYRILYRAATSAGTTGARLRLSAGGTTYDTPINTGGPWQNITGPATVTLPAGTQTITIAAPPGASGWSLNWIRFLRN